MNTADINATDSGGNLEPRQAATLLEESARQARRTFMPSTPLLWVFRAVVALVCFGGFWLSVRGHQDPYAAPSGWALPVAFAFVATNVVWSAVRIRHAATGVSGPAERKRRAWLGVLLGSWIVVYAITLPLYHAASSPPVWGLYPASGPLLIIGLLSVLAAATRRDWPLAATSAAITVVAAAAGFDGPVGAWLIMGIGLAAVMLGTAAFTVWRLHHGLVRL